MEKEPKPVLTGITIRNFKGFGNRPTYIPFRPITLLFGENSVGKSTVLHALVYLREALATGKADGTSYDISGSTLELGDFQRVVHQHDIERDITLRLDFTLEGCPGNLLGLVEGFGSPKDSVGAGDLIPLESGFVQCTIGCDSHRRGHVLEYVVGINNQPVVTKAIFNRKAPNIQSGLCQINLRHPLLIKAGAECPGIGRDIQFFHDHRSAEIWMTNSDGEMTPVIPSLKKPYQYTYPEDIDDIFVSDYASEQQPLLCNLVEQVFVGCTAIANDLLQKMLYIGPLRKVPEGRVRYDESISRPWSTGEAAWQCLVSPGENLKPMRYWTPRPEPPSDMTPEQAMQFLGLMIEWESDAPYKDDFLIERTNQLLEKVEFPYVLAGIRVRSLDENSGEVHRLRAAVSGGVDANKDAVISDFLRHLDGQPVIRECVLIDKRSGTALDPDQVGSGISQMMPMMIALLTRSNDTLIMEQPELHLHPRMQGNLGNLISLLPGLNRQPMVIETHSEHLILRLLKIVRDQRLRLADAGTVLLPEHLSVVYIDQSNEGVTVTELPVDRDGDFKRPWPKGFFEERYEDLF